VILFSRFYLSAVITARLTQFQLGKQKKNEKSMFSFFEKRRGFGIKLRKRDVKGRK